MIYEENNGARAADEDETFDNINCEDRIENLNKKLQATADELEAISALYAKSVKDGLDKVKKN